MRWGNAATFHGYAHLTSDMSSSEKAISEPNDYKARGYDISADEIFVSDGAKVIQPTSGELFSSKQPCRCYRPIYPVYVDSNVMAGRTGTYDAQTETWAM